MNSPPDNLSEPRSQIVLYQTEDGKSRIQVRLENETVWLTQNLMAELFQTTKQNIGQHLKNIFAEGKWQPDSVVAFFATTADALDSMYGTVFTVCAKIAHTARFP